MPSDSCLGRLQTPEVRFLGVGVSLFRFLPVELNVGYQVESGGVVSRRPLTLVLKIGEVSNPGRWFFGGGGEKQNFVLVG